MLWVVSLTLRPLGSHREIARYQWNRWLGGLQCISWRFRQDCFAHSENRTTFSQIFSLKRIYIVADRIAVWHPRSYEIEKDVVRSWTASTCAIITRYEHYSFRKASCRVCLGKHVLDSWNSENFLQSTWFIQVLERFPRSSRKQSWHETVCSSVLDLSVLTSVKILTGGARIIISLLWKNKQLRAAMKCS